MSKIIKLTPEYIQECTREFQEQLQRGKLTNGRVEYTKTFGSETRKATLYFSCLAWLKMNALVQEFEKEVAWHGVAKRGDDESKDDYIVTDILVYPQTVSGASVEMDTDTYQKWLCENFEDERFANIRLQGHSHVNMGVSPSGVDLSHQSEILTQLTDDMFYIFVIWNKRGDKNIKIYDIKKNVMFETNDIEVHVIDDFMAQAKEMVKDRTYSFQSASYMFPSSVSTSSYHTTPKQEDTKPKDTEPKQSSEKKRGHRKGKKQKALVGQTSWYDSMDRYPYNDPFYYSGY